ncbi:disease resistance protein L6-like [Cornus florida]|uniref:disease resistance protein L6-like n=1 Tax=Cornus florida TaxID=4283 RepID=UPI002896ADAA|nr:disease resistance protein L6-like [Cornus florida]XP_059644197.1 disease resistance protein L6-like [Cornus florida]XP_059644198.1 disease resistance protein L6-like [Cornus florida]
MDSEAAGPSKRRTIISEMESDASATSVPVPGGEYEVFLSFRGPDTRCTFTDFLYTCLIDAGVRTFRDDNELRKGEEIGPELLEAIRESSISIPIFSNNYASSKWCLRELAQMVDCKRSTGQLILPIFYDVEPWDVRHQSGSYEEAFRKHERCFDECTVMKWKEALKQVGELKGWHVNKEADRHGELVKTIVQTVSLNLKKKCMVTFDNLVMMDDHLNEMMRLLNVGSKDVRIVGILGMGGIGKTTIAKSIYNKLLHDFKNCCSFLADVRENVKQYKDKGIVDLQNQLLNDTLKPHPPITSVKDGKNAIKSRFPNKKVFIVLDDVDEKSQFDWLVGNRDWFGPGSRIIVTTRNKHVLNILEVDETYEPPFMSPYQSLQLLSFHAFRKKFPPMDFDSICREVVSVTAGLPLALEVIGSFLSDKPKTVWEDTWKKLKKIPNHEVQEKLRVSYDVLTHEQKQIFLDIACLFIGMDKTYPFYMWDDCDYFPETEINVLCLMSLVKLENDNVLRMHDQLRDLGREIVRQEDFENPELRSRLWDRQEASAVFEECMVTEKVQLLNLDAAGKTFENDKFAERSKLRYLQIDEAEVVVGDFKNRLLNLRWLCWRDSLLHFEATNFHMKKLVILDLSGSTIPENWKGWSQIKMASNLKVLDISNTEIRELPDEIRMLNKLEIIDARDSRLTGIRSLPTSIHTLDLGQCVDLEALPELPSSLQVLRVELGSFHVTPNLANLVNLQVLRCNEIPENMNQIIFKDIVELSKLQRLDFGCSNVMTLPKEIDALSQLKFLNLESFIELQCILGLPPNLVGLYIVDVPALEILPDLSNLKLLSELRLNECEKLTKIEGLGKLQSLTSLIIEQCIELREIEGLGNLELLESLRIDGCGKLREIRGLGNLVSLASFCMRWCYKIVKLDLLECSAPLTSSEMRRYKHPENKPDRSNLNKLKSFEVLECRKLEKIEGLHLLVSLECLVLSFCSKLSNLKMLYPENKPDGSNLNKLKTIGVTNCKNLNKIEGLHILVSLEYLDLTHCSSLVRMPNLSNLKMLRHLLLYGCKSLREIEGLEALEALEELDIRGCSSLEKVLHLPREHIHLMK